jgi:hypothetical protein
MHWAAISKYLAVALLVLLSPELMGQQFLEQVTRNKVKTRKYNLGEEITYQLGSDPDRWYTGEILMIRQEDNGLLLGGQLVQVEDIIALRKPNVAMRVVTTFLVSSAFSSIIAIVFTPSVPTAEFVQWIWINAGVGVVALGANRIFLYKKVRIGNRHKLRLLDLDPLGWGNQEEGMVF